jgi:hypothetical protein
MPDSVLSTSSSFFPAQHWEVGVVLPSPQVVLVPTLTLVLTSGPLNTLVYLCCQSPFLL